MKSIFGYFGAFLEFGIVAGEIGLIAMLTFLTIQLNMDEYKCFTRVSLAWYACD